MRVAKKSSLTPRRLPSQERSRATVDAILQAATHLLVKRGWEALTTNAIAERAGVNIASLYQFFPNKEAVVAELQRQHVQTTRAELAAVHAHHRGARIEDRARTFVEAMLAAHEVAPELHRVFSEELPRSQRSAAPERLVLAGSVAELAALGLPNPELAEWIIGTVIHAAVHHAVFERPADVESGALAEELVTLLLRYVRRAPLPRDGAA
jgi:AcrR family transcriptional regulator